MATVIPQKRALFPSISLTNVLSDLLLISPRQDQMGDHQIYQHEDQQKPKRFKSDSYDNCESDSVKGFNAAMTMSKILKVIDPPDKTILGHQQFQPFIQLVLSRIVKRLGDVVGMSGDECGGKKEKDTDRDLVLKGMMGELDELENYVVDRLNTGHWKSVDGVWRRMFSVVCLLKIPIQLLIRDVKVETAIRTCDMGIIMGDRGICEGVLGRIADELSEVLTMECDLDEESDKSGHSGSAMTTEDVLLRNKSVNEFKIREAVKPSMEEFLGFMEGEGMPVKLKGIVDHWPATGKWSVEHIGKVAGLRSVPVEIGRNYTDEDWTQKIMTVNEFIAAYMRDGDSTNHQQNKIGYLAQYDLFSHIPSLARDIITPDYVQLSKDPERSLEVNAWFGPRGTISPAHFDMKHNVFVQVFGVKVMRLFPPKEERIKGYGKGSLLFNTSSVDVEGGGEECMAMKDVVHCDVVVRGGEGIFIPKGWWHYVKSLEEGFSVSFWFD